MSSADGTPSLTNLRAFDPILGTPGRRHGRDRVRRMKSNRRRGIHQTKVSTGGSPDRTNQYQGLIDGSLPRGHASESRQDLWRSPDVFTRHPITEGPMAITQSISEPATNAPSAATVDLKLEVVVIPVSDVDRAKRFYEGLNWRLDADFVFDNGLRVIQFTPPGSACSIQFGTNVTSADPGSAQGLYLIVADIEAARRDLAARGIAISDVFHAAAPGAQFRNGSSGRLGGPAPDHASYRSFATFNDPDGNTWLLQEITTRLPGRGESSVDIATMAALLRDAEMGHGAYEPTAPKHHWSEWYAAYIVARERGKTSEEAAKDGARRIEQRAGA